MPQEGLERQIRDLEDTQRAIVNILEDYDADRAMLRDTQTATFNILEDFNAEKLRAEAMSEKLQREIAERKAAESRVTALNRDLSHRALELKGANAELDAFAYSVSHDLRAPLRHVDGFIQLLSQKLGPGIDPQSARYLTVVQNSARHMGNLIDDLLTFSRMGRAEMSRSEVDLDALVSAIIGEFEPEVRDRSVAWVRSPLPVAQGDAAMLRLVFQNLIGNAIKFTRTREKATIAIGSMGGEEGETVIFVRDNGVGFEMQYVDRLFGIFQRLHRAEEFEGTGIGLANVRRIVARHGGRTWAEGVPGSGAAFYWSLPAGVMGAGGRKSSA